MPTPDAGAMATGFAQVQTIAELMLRAVATFGPMTQQGQELTQMLQKLGKMAPPGSGSPGVQQTEMRNMIMQQTQQQPQMLQRMQPQGAA